MYNSMLLRLYPFFMGYAHKPTMTYPWSLWRRRGLTSYKLGIPMDLETSAYFAPDSKEKDNGPRLKDFAGCGQIKHQRFLHGGREGALDLSPKY